MKKSGGRKSKLIADALKRLCSIDAVVWYEPISGPCFEMCGYAGGWYYADKDDYGDDPDFGNPLGYSFPEAMEMVEILRRHHEHDLMESNP